MDRAKTDTRASASGGRRNAKSRLRGVDVARAIAVVGMVAVHFGPYPPPETAGGDLYGIFHGRASVLFVVLAGVGVSLMTSSRDGWEARGRLIFRGALLLPLGMWLQTLDHNVLVILQYYAVYFLLAAMVLSASKWWLLAGVGISLSLGPILYLLGFETTPQLYTQGYASFGEPVGEVVYDLLLSGAYPLATWAAPLLFGILIGRANLRSAAVRAWLVIGGLGTAVCAALVSARFAPRDVSLLWGSPRYPLDADLGILLSSEPHSQMPLWMIGATGSAVATLGCCLLLADALPRLLWPLVATGQMALTVYVGQILLLSALPSLVERPTVPAAVLSVGTFTVVVAAICTVWRSVLPRGPLEAAFAAPWQLVDALGGHDRKKPG